MYKKRMLSEHKRKFEGMSNLRGKQTKEVKKLTWSIF